MKTITGITICIGILNCSCNNKLKHIRKKSGAGQNNVRQKLHLVSIDPIFQLNEDISVENRRFIFINKKKPGLLPQIIYEE
jgi:hypothetical protein